MTKLVKIGHRATRLIVLAKMTQCVYIQTVKGVGLAGAIEAALKKLRRFALKIYASFLLLGLGSPLSHAQGASTGLDAYRAETPEEDVALRVALIRSAHFIDMLTPVQSSKGPLSAALALALRDAVDRSIKVRFFYDSAACAYENFSLYNDFTAVLRDISVAHPPTEPQVYGMRPDHKIRMGLSLSTRFEESVLIIDRDLPTEVIVVGPAGGSSSQKWTKTLFLRSGSAQASEQIAEAKAHFDKVVNFVTAHVSPKRSKSDAMTELERFKAEAKVPGLSPEALGWVNGTPFAPAEGASRFEFRMNDKDFDTSVSALRK